MVNPKPEVLAFTLGSLLSCERRKWVRPSIKNGSTSSSLIGFSALHFGSRPYWATVKRKGSARALPKPESV